MEGMQTATHRSDWKLLLSNLEIKSGAWGIICVPLASYTTNYHSVITEINMTDLDAMSQLLDSSLLT